MTQALVVPVLGPPWVADWDLSEATDPVGLMVLQQIVGGDIEAIYGPNWHAYVNADGRMLGLRANPRATLLAFEFGWYTGQILVGTVLFLGTGNDSDEHDCPPDLIERAREFPPSPI